MLEVLEILSQSKTPLKHNVIFLFNGAEETPLQVRDCVEERDFLVTALVCEVYAISDLIPECWHDENWLTYEVDVSSCKCEKWIYLALYRV
jgi:hypothetical protein